MKKVILCLLICSAAFAAPTPKIVDDGIDSDMFISGENARQMSEALTRFGIRAEVNGPLTTTLAAGLACAGDTNFQTSAFCQTGLERTYQGLEDGGSKVQKAKSIRLVRDILRIMSKYKKPNDTVGYTMADVLDSVNLGNSNLSFQKIICQTDSQDKQSVCKLKSDSFHIPFF